MKIIGVKVSGFRMLQDNFVIDLRTKARVTKDDYEDEVINVFKNVDMPSSIALVGKNASGKTSVFTLLAYCNVLLHDGQLPYYRHDFSKEKIQLSIVFGDETCLYLYEVEIGQPKEKLDNLFSRPSCLFFNESLKRREKLYKSKEDLFSGFESKNFLPPSPVEGSRLASISMNKSFSFHYSIMFSSLSMNWDSAWSLRFFNSLASDLKKDLITLLDDSIEEINQIPDTNNDFMFKQKGCKEKRISSRDLNYILSDGTKKGLILFSYAFSTLKSGGTLLVDEIEGSFHKNLVNNIIYLFNNKEINIKKANLIFTTHYSEILDSFRRRDPIFVCVKEENKIRVKNVYYDYHTRCELSKSKQFNNNVFDTLLNYNTLMNVRDEIKNEVLSSN